MIDIVLLHGKHLVILDHRNRQMDYLIGETSLEMYDPYNLDYNEVKSYLYEYVSRNDVITLFKFEL